MIMTTNVNLKLRQTSTEEHFSEQTVKLREMIQRLHGLTADDDGDAWMQNDLLQRQRPPAQTVPTTSSDCCCRYLVQIPCPGSVHLKPRRSWGHGLPGPARPRRPPAIARPQAAPANSACQEMRAPVSRGFGGKFKPNSCRRRHADERVF